MVMTFFARLQLLLAIERLSLKFYSMSTWSVTTLLQFDFVPRPIIFARRSQEIHGCTCVSALPPSSNYTKAGITFNPNHHIVLNIPNEKQFLSTFSERKRSEPKCKTQRFQQDSYQFPSFLTNIWKCISTAFWWTL